MRRLCVLSVSTAWLVWPNQARAGMPSVLLTDIASARLQTISFFLMVLLLCAVVVRSIWNDLRGDFPRLPRLSFGKALGLITLWGLLFLMVLTMISGARELLTPGAWTKQGLTYKLNDASTTTSAIAMAPTVPPEAERRAKLERLRVALWSYALSHEGRFPAAQVASKVIAAEVWALPHPSGTPYEYVADRRPGDLEAVVAYEPGLFGAPRLVLMADGETRLMDLDALRKALGTSEQGEH